MGNAMSEREWKLLFEVQRLNRQVEEVVRVQHEMQTIMRADGQAALRMIECIKTLEAKVARLSPPGDGVALGNVPETVPAKWRTLRCAISH